MSNSLPPVPVGYWRDAEGRLVPESMIKPIDKAREDVVQELVKKGRDRAQALAQYKLESLAEIDAFVELSLEEYGVKVGGKKGNLTLYSFDGLYRIERQIQDRIVFDERLQAAKALIDECIHTWTDGSRDEIKVLINDVFQVNKEGLISTGRVLGLKRYNIQDARWQQAMQAIADSVQSAGSKTYVRLYERASVEDQWVPINLDMARA